MNRLGPLSKACLIGLLLVQQPGTVQAQEEVIGLEENKVSENPGENLSRQQALGAWLAERSAEKKKESHNASRLGGAEWKENGYAQGSVSVWSMLQGLGFCVGLFLVLAFFVKRFKRNGLGLGGQRMEVIDRLALSSKTALLIVEVEGRRQILAVGSEQVTCLGNLPRSAFQKGVLQDRRFKDQPCPKAAAGE